MNARLENVVVSFEPVSSARVKLRVHEAAGCAMPQILTALRSLGFCDAQEKDGEVTFCRCGVIVGREIEIGGMRL